MISYKIPASLDNEINEFEELIKSYQDNKISSKEFRAHRVPFGIYEQRKENSYMMRIRCTAGIIKPDQLIKIAELSGKYGHDNIHLTTRQEVQIHNIKVDDIIIILKELRKIGLSTRGGGGNTVRNIIVEENAGVNPDEEFDITPYAVSLTSRLIDESDSWSLPRKYKIAFSSSEADNGYATVNDLGFIAKIKDGKKGFKVYAAGGMGAKPEVGKVLFDFVESSEVYPIARALKQLFDKYGNRKNKHSARIRFLWNKLGREEFIKRFDEEYLEVKIKALSNFEVDDINNIDKSINILPEEPLDNKDFILWKNRFIKPQKQQGLFTVVIPIELGQLKNEAALRLGEFLKHFGENTIRLTKEQNIILRNINAKLIPNIYNFLKVNFLNFNRPLIIDRVISCTGADTCKLGLCLSQKALQYSIIPSLTNSGIDLDALDELKINISGCPNACGQHHIGNIGFFGKVSRNGEKMYPAYNVLVGGRIGDDKTAFGRIIGEISAYKLSSLLLDILAGYKKVKSNYKDFSDYLDQGGESEIKKLLKKYEKVPTFFEDKNYYFDIGASEVFSLASKGVGECSAGLFDLIDVDHDNINNSKKALCNTGDENEKAEILLDIIFYSARMLLITKGTEPRSREEVFDNFLTHFINTKLVDSNFKSIIDAGNFHDKNFILNNESEVFRLADTIIELYNNMDDSLQFKAADTKKDGNEIKNSKKVFMKDFRGVACPMNFVKTKLELAKINKGDELEIYLDDGEPINNVPGSVKSEGHEILEIKKVDNYWSVLIKKD